MPNATVQTVDITGQLITTGGAKVEATQYERALTVQDNMDGTYTIENYYGWNPFYVNINGTPMKGSPFQT